MYIMVPIRYQRSNTSMPTTAAARRAPAVGVKIPKLAEQVQRDHWVECPGHSGPAPPLLVYGIIDLNKVARIEV